MKNPVFYVEDDVMARNQIQKQKSADACIFYIIGYEAALSDLLSSLKGCDSIDIKELSERINQQKSVVKFHNIYK